MSYYSAPQNIDSERVKIDKKHCAGMKMINWELITCSRTGGGGAGESKG